MVFNLFKLFIYSKSTNTSIKTSCSAAVLTATAVKALATTVFAAAVDVAATKTCPAPLVAPVPIINGVPTSIAVPSVATSTYALTFPVLTKELVFPMLP